MYSRLLFIISLFVSSIASAQTTTVYFDFNSIELTDNVKSTLDRLLTRDNNSLGIFGHTDQKGKNDYNEWLSYQRAKAVKDYLLSKGLNANRISVVRGFGSTRPILTGTDSMSMRFNRRVAITNGYKATALDSAIAARQASLNFTPKTNSDSTVVASTTTPETKTVTKAVDTIAKQPPAVKKEEPVVKQQKSEKLIEDIKDKNTKVGENIVLRNINFHAGSRYFLESALAPLQDLSETMQKVKTLEIEIQGHVCCTGGDNDAFDNETNQQNLSVTRAKAVYDYLIEKGIDKSRLSYKGLAHQFPLIKDEVTEEDMIANRRVEIKIVKK